MPGGGEHTYFFYGTLIDADVRAAVLGRAVADLEAIDDTLPGWRRVFMAGKTYPVIVPSPAQEVTGVRMTIPGEQARRRLTYFEGPEYRIERVTLASGGEADVYAGSKQARPGTRRWEFDIWKKRDKARFLARIRAREQASPN